MTESEQQFKTYSIRSLNPYSGTIQIVESDSFRAVSMDGHNWELHLFRHVTTPKPAISKEHRLIGRLKTFFKYGTSITDSRNREAPQKVFSRFGSFSKEGLQTLVGDIEETRDHGVRDLASFLLYSDLPFKPADRFECWLLDREDSAPLALLYSCTRQEDQQNFPRYPEWTALPAALMPVVANEQDLKNNLPPVNYRVERLIAERAGPNPVAMWFDRTDQDPVDFPPYLVKSNWQQESLQELCWRYLSRQSPRLLMLPGLSNEQRGELETAARSQALEVSKYHHLYPDAADQALLKSILVEAKFREVQGEKTYEVKSRWS